MQKSRGYHSAEDLMSLEKLIDEKTAEVGRNLYRANVQKVADTLPRTRSASNDAASSGPRTASRRPPRPMSATRTTNSSIATEERRHENRLDVAKPILKSPPCHRVSATSVFTGRRR